MLGKGRGAGSHLDSASEEPHGPGGGFLPEPSHCLTFRPKVVVTPTCWLAGTVGAGEGAPLPGRPTPAVAQGLAGILAFLSV